jgi:hypothetical protein
MKPYRDGVRLLQLFDNWTIKEAAVTKDPDRYLLMLENFLKDVLP